MPGKKRPKKIVRVRDVTGLMRVRVRQRAFGELLSSDSEDSDYDPGFSHEPEKASSSSSSSYSSTSMTEDSEMEEEETSPAPSTSKKRRKTSKQPAKKQKRSSSAKPKPKPKKSKPKTTARSGRTIDQAEASTSSAGASSSGPAVKSPVIIVQDCKVPTLPSEILLKVLQFAVHSAGCVPFLCRAARVCSQWRQVSEDPVLWRKVDLSRGWIKSTEATLRWLADHRLSGCQELSLASWANLKSEWLQYLAERCPNLREVNLNYCKKISGVGISSLVDHCPHLSGLNFAFTSTDCVSTNCIKHLVETRGSQLTHLEFGGNTISNFNGVLNLLMAHCPNLEVLDMSNLYLGGAKLVPVERMHRAWPGLQVFRASNVTISCTQVSQQERDLSPGFPQLQEISLATHTHETVGSYLQGVVNSGLLSGLCKNATKLRLLDLRGCTSLRTSDLSCVCAEALEQVHLARVDVSNDGTLCDVLSKHRHSMVELDLSGMLGAMLVNSVKALGQGCPLLEVLDLSFTHLDEPTLKIVLKGTPKLRNLNLESCRSLPRGIKRRYHSAAEIKKLLKTLEH